MRSRHEIRSLRFWVPARSDVHIAIRARPLVEQSFAATLEVERAELLRSLPGAQLMERTGLSLLGREARMFMFGGASADGVPVRFCQAFLKDDDAVVVVSALGEAEHESEVRTAFEQLLAEAEERPG